MTIREIANRLNAKILTGEELLDTEVDGACGSDLMSDVLAFGDQHSMLLTGLTNPQVIRTAMMLDMPCVVFVRGKPMPEETLALARASGLCTLATDIRLFEACGLLYAGGVRG
ncbi:MAG: hypothetical protein FWE69_05485 [Clostridiales bacterium]|nr:hypothetical protein [Clostridiales bacterium]